MRTYRTLALLMLCTTSAALAQDEAPQGPPPAPVEVANATNERLSSVVWMPGTVVSRHDARIAAEVSGRLTWVADVGDTIEAGDVLAKVDDAMLQLERREAETSIQQYRTQLDYSAKRVNRLQSLANSNSAAAQELDNSQAEKSSIEQQLAQAQLALDRINLQIEKSQVKAPFAGQVAERVAQPGEFIAPGGQLVRLVDLGNLEIRAQAPMAAASYVSRGMNVLVRQGESEELHAVRTVIPVGDERSRMFEVRVSVPHGSAVVGGAVRVAMPTSEPRSVVAIPRDALVLRSNETFVYRVNADGAAERITVEPGIGYGSLVEVRGELAPGDTLVVRGGERLQPGQTVSIVSERLTNS